MVDLSLNEAGAAAKALEGVWSNLAPVVNEAKKLQADAARDPSLMEDPWVKVHVGWINVFEREIAAVQKVYDTSENGPGLAADDIRAAEEAGGKLLGIISEARSRVREPQPA